MSFPLQVLVSCWHGVTPDASPWNLLAHRLSLPVLIKLVYWNLRNHIFVLDETLSRFLNLAAQHPWVQMVRVHSTLHGFTAWQVVFLLDIGPSVHYLSFKLILLFLFFFVVVGGSQLWEFSLWVLRLHLYYIFAFFAELVDGWFEFHSFWVNYRNHVFFSIQAELVKVWAFANLRFVLVGTLLVFWLRVVFDVLFQ